MPDFSERLEGIKKTSNLSGLGNITRGIEKESLRVNPKGTIAKTAHPKALGSALTHPCITTDYSEALLEFITAPDKSIQHTLKKLQSLHRFTYQHIGNESLWVNSMPCMLSTAKDIPIAQYGSSNSGRMKSVYRLGLGHRYGRPMQTIAGTHFNFSVDENLWQHLRHEDKSELSLQDYKTEGYFRLIRNFRRYFWLLLYLFGAAPAVCKSFVKNRDHGLEPIGKDDHSLHTPYATSLRMGNLGYQSAAQDSLVITYNCLDSYIDSLCKAITKTDPNYQDIGVFDEDGEHQQLNDSLLQIENEFYSVIRPKRSAKSGQAALNALEKEGIEYIEVRCLDLNPFADVGISENQIRFLDLFLLFCLLEDSPLSDNKEYHQQQSNQKAMVYDGRNPSLELFHFGKKEPVKSLAEAIFTKLEPLANLLDENDNTHFYQDTLRSEKTKLSNYSLTPSSKILEEIQNQELTFFRWAMNASIANKEHFSGEPLDLSLLSDFQSLSQQSIDKQKEIEKTDTMSFEAFLENYYAQYKCNAPTFINAKKKSLA